MTDACSGGSSASFLNNAIRSRSLRSAARASTQVATDRKANSATAAEPPGQVQQPDVPAPHDAAKRGDVSVEHSPDVRGVFVPELSAGHPGSVAAEDWHASSDTPARRILGLQRTRRDLNVW